MNTLWRAPFALLAFFFGILALILACITANQACYDQPYGGNYIKVLGDGACDNVCTDHAYKLIGTPTTETANQGTQFFFPSNRVARCPWRPVGKRLFLASSSLIVLWFFIEFWLLIYGKYYPILHIFELLTLGLAVPTAIYMHHDLTNNFCIPWYSRGFKCYSSIFTVSFIILILSMCCMFLNILINWSRRKRLVQRKANFSNAPLARDEMVPFQQEVVVTQNYTTSGQPQIVQTVVGQPQVVETIVGQPQIVTN